MDTYMSGNPFSGPSHNNEDPTHGCFYLSPVHSQEPRKPCLPSEAPVDRLHGCCWRLEAHWPTFELQVHQRNVNQGGRGNGEGLSRRGLRKRETPEENFGSRESRQRLDICKTRHADTMACVLVTLLSVSPCPFLLLYSSGWASGQTAAQAPETFLTPWEVCTLNLFLQCPGFVSLLDTR